MDWKHWLNRAVEEVVGGHPQFHLISTDDGRVPEIDSEIGERHPLIFRVNIQEEYFQPYYPFLSWAKTFLSEDINPEFFLEEAKIYYFQRPIFQNYLWGTHLEREEILPYEERWEEDQFHLSLWNLLIHLLDGRVGLFVIENAQELGRSTLKALLNWRKKNLNGRVIFLLVQRQNHEPAEREHVSFWEEFVDTWGVWKQFSQTAVKTSSQKKIRRYSLRDLQASITHLGYLIDFFCLEEADELANRLYMFYQRHPRSFPEDLLLKLLEYMGWCNYFQDRILQSLSMWAHQLSLVPNLLWVERSRLTRYLAQCFLKLREDQKASALAYRALEMAQQSQNQLSIYYAMHVVLWSELNNPTMSPEQWKKEFRRFLEMGQELDHVNTLAFWLVNPYLMDSVEQVSEATYYQQWGIELCEKYQNYFLLSYGYLNIGYFWSIKGEYEKVLESYQKSEELKIRIGRLEELPQVYNSRGYFLMNIGNYLEAQENFSKALSGLYHYRSIVEIGLTLFNLAINAFRAEHWERAERDFQRLYTFLRNLDLQSLIFHGKREVLIYLGLCQIHQNKLTKALETWLKLSQEPPNNANWDEQLLFLIFKANIHYYETGKESLLSVFQEAENFMLKHKVDLRFLVPWFYYYFGQLFNRAGLESQSVQCWKKGYMESFQLPNVKIRQRLQDLLNGKREEADPIPLPDPTRETVEWIIDTAREFKYVREVQKNKATVDILMNFQELLSALASNEEIIYDTMRIIERGFLFDGLSLFDVITGNQRLIYQSPSLDEETMEVIKQILPDFKNQGGLMVIPDICQDPWNFKDIHPHFGLIFVSGDFLGEYQLFFAARFALQFHYSSHEERVLQLIISQLSNLVGRRHREKNLFDENLLLRKLVYKDSLTGVLNRRGILEKIQEETSRLLRYNKGTCSLLVMDIVNIHALNHDLGYVGGDGILKSIASYLDRMVRTVDIVGRIGGSLFCLILPETGKEGSCRLIERITQRLQDFVIDINSIEHRIKLELCFGGAEWRKVDEDLLERANHALKYAKENGLTYFFHGEDV